ncbi:hypothetical protein D910_05490 [Dendroctonus ponderosae]|uniref:Uncharacterized protein n=1 Tax=Dendroctonus ponderosae TaxID=77166 RepID=U4UBX0_DENPD|nr:hypothetical protein D910_05490 [Dendroctonus ponderosae]
MILDFGIQAKQIFWKWVQNKLLERKENMQQLICMENAQPPIQVPVQQPQKQLGFSH